MAESLMGLGSTDHRSRQTTRSRAFASMELDWLAQSCSHRRFHVGLVSCLILAACRRNLLRKMWVTELAAAWEGSCSLASMMTVSACKNHRSSTGWSGPWREAEDHQQETSKPEMHVPFLHLRRAEALGLKRSLSYPSCWGRVGSG